MRWCLGRADTEEELGKGTSCMATLGYLWPAIREDRGPMVINWREEASRACRALDTTLKNGAMNGTSPQGDREPWQVCEQRVGRAPELRVASSAGDL